MHKFLLALVLGSSLTYASTINGIAITVNDEPITQYDIEKTMSVNIFKYKEIYNPVLINIYTKILPIKTINL